MEIRYLKDDEKQNIRPIYQECFEYTEEFVNYYFENRIHDNKILAAFENGIIVAVLQLVDKKVVYQGEAGSVHCIYGMATRPEYRLQGYMKELVEYAACDLKKIGEPFVYLVSNNTEPYVSLGFRKVYDKQLYRTRKMQGVERIYEPDEVDIHNMMILFENFIPPKYHTYLVHDEDYYRQALEELKLKNGYLVYHIEDEEIVGYSLVTGDNYVLESVYDVKPVQLYLKKTVPWIMIRPLCEECAVRKVFINDEL